MKSQLRPVKSIISIFYFVSLQAMILRIVIVNIVIVRERNVLNPIFT